MLAAPPAGIVGFVILGRVPLGVTGTQEYLGADGSGFGVDVDTVATRADHRDGVDKLAKEREARRS